MYQRLLVFGALDIAVDVDLAPQLGSTTWHHNVGRLLEHLDQLGIADNTIFLRPVLAGHTPSRDRREEIRAVTSHAAHSSFAIIDQLARCVGSHSYYADNPKSCVSSSRQWDKDNGATVGKI